MPFCRRVLFRGSTLSWDYFVVELWGYFVGVPAIAHLNPNLRRLPSGRQVDTQSFTLYLLFHAPAPRRPRNAAGLVCQNSDVPHTHCRRPLFQILFFELNIAFDRHSCYVTAEVHGQYLLQNMFAVAHVAYTILGTNGKKIFSSSLSIYFFILGVTTKSYWILLKNTIWLFFKSAYVLYIVSSCVNKYILLDY